MNETPVLSLANVSKRFDAVAAVSKVSFKLFAGRIYALIGPNGAGKTTLLNVISGYIECDAGSIKMRDQAINNWTASRRVLQGMARTFQITQLFGHMTALENVMCGFQPHITQSITSTLLGLRSFIAEEQALRTRANELLDTVGIGAYAEDLAGLLPFGLQRRLEVARALATQPSILLLDEPCAGLSGTEANELGSLLIRLANRGMCILVVEHNMPFVLGVAEQIVVLDAGEVIAAGRSDEVRNDARVIEAYLGEAEHGAA